uniref:Odorant-binding protein 10 n=1 Tax=Dastarcus helophoroides TaxID=1169899 RepID=A0A1I9HZP4_9CUCU|nr:odorant-binding protein 10 [Dastarcus helophoroides]
MNATVKSCLLLFLLGIVCAYDFEDSEYNQLLAQHIDDFNYYDSFGRHVRSRRDEEAVNPAKCRPRKRMPCCGESVLEELHDKDKDIRRQCFREIIGKDKEPRGEHDPFRCDRIEKHRKEMTCVMQCVEQKKDLLDESGNVNEEEFAKFVSETFEKEAWRANQDADACSNVGIKLDHCIFREIQLNCPEDQIKDQKACNRLQERLKNKNRELNSLPPEVEP